MRAVKIPKSKITRHKLEEVAERDGASCIWCSRPLTVEGGEATLDHLVPDCRHGSSHLDNLVLSCFSCNNRRGRMPAAAFLAEQLERGATVRQDLLERAWERALGSNAFRVGVGALVEKLYASGAASAAEAEPFLVQAESLWQLRLPVRVIAAHYFTLKSELEQQLAAISDAVQPLHDLGGSELADAVASALPGRTERVLGFLLWRGRAELAHELLFRDAIVREFATQVLDALQPLAAEPAAA